MTRKELRAKMKPSPALIAAVESYLRFRSAAETLKPIMDKLTRLVMAEFRPQYSEQWATSTRGEACWSGEIVDPQDLFMMDESQWSEFYRLLALAKRAAGFSGYPDECCPHLMCESRMTDAETAIIEEVAKHPGLEGLADVRLYLNTQDELIEIALKWVAPHVSKARIEAIPLPFTYTPTDACKQLRKKAHADLAAQITWA